MGLRSVRRGALLAGLALIWVPTVAHAAIQLAVPKGCIYGSTSAGPTTIPFNVSGLAANAHWTLSLDGAQVAAGDAGAGGLFTGTFAAPAVHHGERVATLSATDGKTTATQTVDLTDFDAVLTPATGSTRRAVRVGLWGWLGKTVFLHYVAPRSHRVARTVRIARTGGICGHAHARLAHLFGHGTKKGHWKLVFDTKRKLSKSSDPLRIEYDIAVR